MRHGPSGISPGSCVPAWGGKMARSIAQLGATSLCIAFGTVMLPTTVMGSAERTETAVETSAPLEEGRSADQRPALTEAAAPAIEKERPTENLGAGASELSGSGYHGGNGGEVETGGCTPSKTCADMFDACQDIDGKCTKGYPGCDVYGSTSCVSCRAACQARTAYPPACKCSSCGFTE